MSNQGNSASYNVQALIAVVDEIFKVLEETRDMLESWKEEYHRPFVDKMWYLQSLRKRMYALGYSDDFADTVIRIVYRNVFIKTSCLAYAGSKSKDK